MTPAAQRTPEEERVKRGLRGALWEIGDLSWALHPLQLEDLAFREAAYERGVRRVVELCGRRYGKTRGLVVDAFETAIRRPGCRIPYAAKTWESAAAYVLPEARYLIENAPKHLRPEIVGGEVRFPNRSVIVISGSHTVANADNLRGPDSVKAIIDEAGFNDCLDYVANDVLQAQLIRTAGMMIIASSAPLTPTHPFVAHVKRARARGALITRTTLDAPHLTRDEIEKFAEEIGGMDSTSWAREAMCEIVTDENRAVVPEWRKHKAACVGEVAPREHRHFYVAADLGYVDLTVILLAWVDWYGAEVDGVLSGPRLVVVGERVLERPTSFDVQAAAASLERQHQATGRVRARVADAPAITVADLRRLHGKLRTGEEETAAWRVPRKDDLEGAVNLVRLLVRRHQIVISPDCERLLADVNDAVWNLGRTEFDRVGDVGHYDALAALVYLCRTADLSLCPEPQVYIPHKARQKAHPGEQSRVALPSAPTRVRQKRIRR